MLFQIGHVFEVTCFGDVEINPHHAVIGQGREDLSLLDQAALLEVQAVDDAVKRCFDGGKVQFGVRQLRIGLGLGQLGLEQQHLILRDHFVLVQLLGVIVLQLRELCLGQLGVRLFLVKNRDDLEQHVILRHLLTFLDFDRLEISSLQGTDLDVALRVDLADISLDEGQRLRLRVGGRNLMGLDVLLLLVHAACRHGKGNQRQDDGLNWRDFHSAFVYWLCLASQVANRIT